MLSNSSRGTLISYTDHSAQRRYKSNTPIYYYYFNVTKYLGLIQWRESSMRCNIRKHMQKEKAPAN